MKRNRRILVVFVLIWISVVVYFMYKNDSSEVLVAIDVDRYLFDTVCGRFAGCW